MWHEARRQEKAVRIKMVDTVKRQERKKQFYESVRREPEEFMQLHGQKMLIHVDPLISETAESSNILRKWQGDPSILIDRFDVRVHLEQIQEISPKQTRKTILKDDVVELQCEYERYRILVLNEFKKVSERDFLNQISMKEFWPIQAGSVSSSSAYKKEQEKKRKMADKKAAIAFSYTDSETIKGHGYGGGSGDRKEPSSSSDEEDDLELEEPQEIDPVIDPNELSAEQAAALNKIGTHYCITSGAFLPLLNLDRKEQTSTAQIKEIDKAKLALSGRNAKADRVILKRRRAMIIGNLGTAAQTSEEATTSLLSFLTSANKGEAKLKEETSSSESGEEFVRTEFIKCFGGEEERNGAGGTKGNKGGRRITSPDRDEEEENKGVVHGPILPTKEYRRLLELSRRKSASPESQWNEQKNKRRRDRPSRSPVRRRTPSRSRSGRRRESSRRRRSRSRERYGKHRQRRSSSSSSSPSLKQSRKRQRERDEYREEKRKERGGHSRNRSSDRQNHNKPNIGYKGTGTVTTTMANQEGLLKSASRSSSSSSDGEPDSPLAVRSSMSESEKERIERENRKRRIRRTKRIVRDQQQQGSQFVGDSSEMDHAVESRAEKAAKKLRQQMHRALTKTAAQLKEEEENRQKEMLREKKEREERLLEESRNLRQREREKLRIEEDRDKKEREKRHQHGGSRRLSHHSSGNDSKRRRNRSRS